MPKFDWSQLQEEQPAPQSGGGKFDWSQLQEETPKEPSFMAGSVKSAIDSLPMVGGVAGGILGTPADAVAGPMGNVAGAAIGGYLGTAAKNLINRYYDPASAPTTTTQAITQPVVGGVEQGLMQGAGEAIAPVIGKGVQAAASGSKYLGAKMLSNLGGVNPAVIKEYAQFSNRINAAPSVDALKELSDDFVGKLSADVDAKKITADQAQEALKGFQSDLKDQYKTAGYDARDAVTSAQQTLKDAHNARIQQLSGDVYDSVNRLKSDVQSGSSQALDVLGNSDKMVRLKPIYEEINSQIGRAQQAGTKEGAALAQELTDYRDGLAKAADYSGKINPVDAKRRIQGIDQITTYSPMAGSFDKMKNSAYKDIRSAFDSTVKDAVPEYRLAMAPVAADADLLNRVSDFGDKQSAVGILQRINSPNQLERRAALQELGNKYGADFVNSAQPQNLPEQGLLNRAQASQDALRPDRVAGKIDQTVSNSRLNSAASDAQSALSAAQDKLAPFKSLAPNGAGQTQAQQKLLQLGKGKNIELTDMFQKLGNLTGTDFVQAMKDQNTLAAFQKGATNGSRNTLMGALTGFAFGGVGGAAVGGSAGRVVDQWGPAITKKILDGAIRVSERPSVQTIRALELPEPIKRNMIAGLENYLTRPGESASMGMVADNDSKANRTPATGEERWVQDGASRLGLTAGQIQQLSASPQYRRLLIQASGLKPGNAALSRIQSQVQKGFGK